MSQPPAPIKNVIGMDEHKAKARGNTAQSRLCLWSSNGEAGLVLDYTADAPAVMVSLGEGGDAHFAEFERVALSAWLERALVVVAPLQEPEEDGEYDDGA